MLIISILCGWITLLSATASVNIPSSYSQSAIQCTIKFDDDIRRVYPQYGMVGGRGFVASVDIAQCAVLRSTTSPDDSSARASCLQSHPGEERRCSNWGTSVVRVANGTSYFCFTNYFNPTSKAVWFGDNQEEAGVGLPDTCLYDANRRSPLLLNSELNVLYSATDTLQTDTARVTYTNLSSGVTRNLNSLTTKNIEKYIGMFVRGDFLYTVYLDSTNKTTRISRSCKDDKSSSPTNNVMSYTYASAKCTLSSGNYVRDFDRAVTIEYSETVDKLFVLFTRYPADLNAVVLCQLSLADVDKVFDTADYIGYDEEGAPVKKAQGKIECSTSRSDPVDYECADTISTTAVLLTRLGSVRHFAIYQAHNQSLVYLLDGDTLLIYSYQEDGAPSTLIQSVDLWVPDVAAFAIYNDTYYIASDRALYQGEPYWCGYHARDPVLCLASRHPSCAYSTTRASCIPTKTCGTTDCVQSLTNGSFSSVFPHGYEYTENGTVCTADRVYVDTTYHYLPNTTLTTTNTTRGCDEDTTPTKAPIHVGSSGLSATEIGLLIPLVVFTIATILLVLALLRSNSKLCWADRKQSADPSQAVYHDDIKHKIGLSCQIKSDRIDCQQVRYDVEKDPIVPPDTPTANKRPSMMGMLTSNPQKPAKAENGHNVVFRNESAGAVELGKT